MLYEASDSVLALADALRLPLRFAGEALALLSFLPLPLLSLFRSCVG